MTYPTPEHKFEGLWKFDLEPTLRKMFYQIFKEGIVYAVQNEKKPKEKKRTDKAMAKRYNEAAGEEITRNVE